MFTYNEKYFANYVENVKDIECEEESKDVFHQERQRKHQ